MAGEKLVNVVPIRPFDQDATEVIQMVNPTPPSGIPFDTLLAGPASDPDAGYSPVQHPVPRSIKIFTFTAAGYLLGVCHAVFMINGRLF